MRTLVEEGEPLSIVGVVQPSEDASAAMLSAGIAYPTSLTEYVVEQAAASTIVQEQMEDPGRNVLTGNAFGEDNGQEQFDMESLFSVDEDAMREAFSFDADALDMDMSEYFAMDEGSLDLEGLLDMGGLEDMELDLPDLPPLDMGEVLSQLDLAISEEAIQQMVQGLLDGYDDYAAEHPEADYSRLNEYFMDYLETPEGQQVLQEGLLEIVQSNMQVTIFS